MSIALLFPGQGSQYAGMATGLYGSEPVFTDAMDRVLALIGDDELKQDWLGQSSFVDIDDVRRAQPLLFAVDYALGCMVHSWGVEPVAMLGHSAGELVAATFAGVFTLEEAVRSQMDRVKLATGIPEGGMLAVAATEEQLLHYLADDVAIAAVNANRQVMLAGSKAPLALVEKLLREDAFTVAVVPATSPFHSPAMIPAAQAAEVGLQSVALKAPAKTMYSGYTADLLTEADATKPAFWANQVVDTVYFGPALERLLAKQDALLVEVGPGQTLTAFARRQKAVRAKTSEAMALLPNRSAATDLSDIAAAQAKISARNTR